jgi:allantoate deiminase/N-carbamoyl-L-amino-acid hydrolase
MQMNITLDYLNDCPAEEFAAALDGIYAEAEWVARRAAPHRPFSTLTELKLTLQSIVMNADDAEQLRLIRAHRELTPGEVIGSSVVREWFDAHNDPASASRLEFSRLQELNAQYFAKFGFPFVVALLGPDGNGLTWGEMLALFERRLANGRKTELRENLNQIGRIAELRLNALLQHRLDIGDAVMQWSDMLARWSDDEDGLTCSYMTTAHRKTAAQLATWMREAGMEVHIDAVGNVVGRYLSLDPHAKTLMTGSHYDTVRNAGRFDGRAGILIAIAVVRLLHRTGQRLPFHVEVVGFAEEEGERFKYPFLGSKAISGTFDMRALESVDAEGNSLRTVLLDAGHNPGDIPGLARRTEDVLGFIEIHIEQGPLLLEHQLPVGIVRSIAGSRRYIVDLRGAAGHAGTTPMALRRDALAAAAEVILMVEARCRENPSLVGTVVQIAVPDGVTDAVPGACRLLLDVRAADDATRDLAVDDIMAGIGTICRQRDTTPEITLLLDAPAVPCSPSLMQQLSLSARQVGVPPFELASGAGHDAMVMASITNVAMLFIRCGNGGLSHTSLETMTADDADVAGRLLLDFLLNFSAGHRAVKRFAAKSLPRTARM